MFRVSSNIQNDRVLDKRLEINSEKKEFFKSKEHTAENKNTADSVLLNTFMNGNVKCKTLSEDIPRKCHNHQAQPPGDIERRNNEEQPVTKETPHMSNGQRRTATEDPPWNGK